MLCTSYPFQVAGFLAVVLTGIWMGHYRGGFAWSDKPVIQFNWHPLLMTLGLIYLYGNGKIRECEIGISVDSTRAVNVACTIIYTSMVGFVFS